MDTIRGQTLLTIVARGQAITTELFKLIDLVPSPFKQERQLFLDQSKRFTLNNLICDFSYFGNVDLFEAQIESNDILKKADEDFCEKFNDILTRFYLTFESINRYATDLNNLVADLEEEIFVGQLIADNETLQLLCEAYFLLGYMLLAVDNNFEGSLREKLIVGYYRYSSYKSSPDSNLAETCNLFRSTGYRSESQVTPSSAADYCRPEGYPENYFARLDVNQSFISLLVARMQSCDIYNQTFLAYPHPDHRSTALSQQASMLYVILYFCPNILKSQRSRMREITDKFFYDNWVINVYMGDLINLIEAWEPYKAARESIIQLYEPESTLSLANHNNVRFYRYSKLLQDNLKEGWLEEDTALENQTEILNLIKNSNITLKWTLLHSQLKPSWRSRLAKALHSIVISNQPNLESLFMFLQNLADLEKKFSAICDQLLGEKNNKIHELKRRATGILQDLISTINDAKSLRWTMSADNPKLAGLLVDLLKDLETIDLCRPDSRDCVSHIIGELEQAQESHTDGKNLQIVQLFALTKKDLLTIIKLLTLNSNIKVILQTIGEFSYAWQTMDSTFTLQMQHVIKKEPLKVYGIESILLKLASSFDILLIRIQQIDSRDDLISVSRYYSMKLVAYVRDVLQIIPATILELVSIIINIQTNSTFGDMPSKVSLDNLKDFVLADERYQMLELTYKISHYAESLQLMQDATIGLIRINSKQLLEDGIRRELVARMSDSIQSILHFPKTKQNLCMEPRSAAKNLIAKLERLNSVMNGYKRSFEYLQDYLFIYGLRIWQEELSNIIKFSVGMAINTLQYRTYAQDSHHSSYEPPTLNQHSKASLADNSLSKSNSSFILRILNEILKITEPRATIYEEQMSAWYEQKSPHDEVMDLSVFELLASSLSTAGLNGLDQICCFMLVLELQKLDAYLISSVSIKSFHGQDLVEVLELINKLKMKPIEQQNKQQLSKIFSSALTRIAPHSDTIVNYLLRIGQLQAIRTNLSLVVSTKCRYEARHLFNCLDTLNSSLLSALRHGEKSSQQKLMTDMTEISGATNRSSATDDSRDERHGNENPVPSTNVDSTHDSLEESQLIFELTNHLEWVGLSDPFGKIYTLALQASNNSQVVEFRERLVAVDLVFLILLDQCSKFHFSRSISGFLPKQSRSFYETSCTVDGQPLFYGVTTLMNHYQPYLDVATSPVNRKENIPTRKLLELMSLYVKCSLNPIAINESIKPNELTLEVANMILCMIELLRLTRQKSEDLLIETYLPEFVADTFQFSICQLNSVGNTNKN